MSRVVRLFLGGLFNELTQDTYRRWFVYQMRVSQALLIASFASFIIGLVVLVLRRSLLHGDLMLGGLVLFYVGIMFSQHPGFTRVMPSPFASLLLGALSLVWFITYVLGLWFNWVWGLAFAVYYILLLIKGGLGRIPLYWPNTFFLSGLVSFAVAVYTGGLGLVTFPIASIVSLVRRVEGRQRPWYAIDLVYAVALPIMTYFIRNFITVALLSLLTFVVIGVPRGFGPGFKTIYSRAYPVGSSLARVTLVMAVILSLIGVSVFDVLHLLFIGFIAVIMSVLCIPMLIPGILWFSMRFYGVVGYEIPTLLFISALLRALYFLASHVLVAASLLLVFIAYLEVAISYLSGKRVQVL